MKKLIYLLLAFSVCLMIVTGFTKKENTIIVIQSMDKNTSSVSLSQSAKIIEKRLKEFSSGKYDVTVIPEKNQVKIVCVSNANRMSLEELVSQKGNISFYETYNRMGLSAFIKDDDHLFSLIKNNDSKDAKIGCVDVAGIDKANDYLNSVSSNPKYKFAWAQFPEGSEWCLYALKTGNEREVKISGNDIKTINLNPINSMNKYDLEIRFINEAVTTWSNLTKRNINNTIAIVLDGKVCFAPVVRDEITGGTCSITGNFTEDQLRFFSAIGNNGELPLNFKIIK